MDLGRVTLLLRWLRHLPVAVTYAATLALVAGAGSYFGSPQLLWHEQLSTQVLAGASLMALCAELTVVVFLLTPPGPTLRVHLLAPGLVLLLFMVLGRRADSAAAGWAAIVAAAAVLGAVHVPALGQAADRFARPLAIGVWWVRDAVAMLRGRDRPSAPAPGSGHALQGLLVGLIAVIYLMAHVLPLPALMVVALGVMLLNAIWGFWAFWRPDWHVWLTLGSIGLVLVVGGLRDPSLPGLPVVELGQVVRPAPLATGTAAPQVPGLLDDAGALRAWRRAVTSATPAPVLVVVATSGGASRSALWTATVLTDLEARLPGFPSHIRLITGASGGMLGAAHYVARLGQAARDTAAERAVLVDRIARDSLTPLVRELLQVRGDRGEALQRAWENAAPELARPLADLRAGEEQGWRPSLVFAPMMVEDGRRLLISNLNLKPLTEPMAPLIDPQDKCPERPERCRLSITSLQLFEIFPDGAARVPLSAAARMSSTFPWVTSAVRLPTRPARRVVDAGYYDSYGVSLAVPWLARHADWLVQNTGGVLLLQIRDERLTPGRNNVEAGPGQASSPPFISPLSTPPEAVLKARESTTSFRNDELVQAMASSGPFAERPDFFRTAVFELGGTEPLSWYTTAASRRRITAGMGLAQGGEAQAADPCAVEWNQVTFARLCAWWRQRNGSPEMSCPDEPPIRRCR